MLRKIKVFIFRWLLTESEKCLLNQALNLQYESIRKDCISPDYKADLQEIYDLLEMCKNKLWY